MHEIFVSYRRVDTESSAGHLYSDLCRRFGKTSVFMDIGPGNIPWGADYEKSLSDALQGCEVLLALIGPQWATCERTPGKRRLDAPDDWVRKEIATVLRRGKPIKPVLLQGAGAVPVEQLPEELRTLRFDKGQAYSISNRDWDVDTRQLLDTLADIPRLRQLQDATTAAAEAMSRSPALIETADREIDELRLLKMIHDALHAIEESCVIPFRGDSPPVSLKRARISFGEEDVVIRDALHELSSIVPDLPMLLELDLPGHLSAVAAAFAAVGDNATANERDLLIQELEGLFGEIPMRLSDAIDNASRRLELHQLRQLMSSMLSGLDPRSRTCAAIARMTDNIVALDALDTELKRRIAEHGILQSLDNRLRRVLRGKKRAEESGRIDPPEPGDWNDIRRIRARFKPPFSKEVADRLSILGSMESDVDAAMQHGEPSAGEQLSAYGNEVGELFRKVDSRLKEFFFELRTKTAALKTILELCRLEVSHV